MAHEFESGFFVREAAWHGLGTVLDNPPSTDIAIVEAGLNWSVSVEALNTMNGELSQARSIRRLTDRRELGTCGQRWQPLQNSEAFKWFDPYIESGLVTLETAGSLFEGSKVWILAKINDDPINIIGNDSVNKYLLLFNAHDGCTGVGIGFTPIRVVCNNTLSAAMKSNISKLLQFRHGKNVVSNVEKIRDVINVINREFNATVEQYRFLASIGISENTLEKYVNLVSNKKAEKTEKAQMAESDEKKEENGRKVKAIMEYFETNPLECPRTFWGMYNAVNGYEQHVSGGEGENRDENRLNKTWFGSFKKNDLFALQTAISMAQEVQHV